MGNRAALGGEGGHIQCTHFLVVRCFISLFVCICQVTQLSMMLEETNVDSFDDMEAYFIVAMIWSLGGALLEDGRIKLDNYI